MRILRLISGRKPLSEFIDDFARRELNDLLGEMGQPPARAIETFPSGRNTVVRKIVLANGNALVLRAYFLDMLRRKAFTHRYLNRRLGQQGFMVPEILIHRTYPFRRGRRNVEIFIEEFIPGETLGTGPRNDPELAKQLAVLFDRLHRNCSPRPGLVWLDNLGLDPVRVLLFKVSKYLERLRRKLPEITESQLRRAERWAENHATRYRAPKEYELVLGNFQTPHLQRTGQNDLALIDLGSMMYGCFEGDLVYARLAVLEPESWRIFREEYFSRREESRERFERNASLFFGLSHLAKASFRAVRARKAAEAHDDEAAEAARAAARLHWNRFLMAVESEESGE